MIAFTGFRSVRPLVFASTSSESNKSKDVSPTEVDTETETDVPAKNSLPDVDEKSAPRKKRRAGSSDWIASAVTRRFG